MSPKVQVAIAVLLAATRASGLQPLEEFLRGARASAPDVAEARAAERQAGAEAQGALGRVLPRLSLAGTYVRNEEASTLTLPDGRGGTATLTLTPRELLEGTAALDVPLVDASAFARVAAARTGSAAAARERAAADLRIESLVSQDYYQLVANAALVAATGRAVEAARENQRIAESRQRAGAVPLLDVDRARAEVERNLQQRATAELQVALVARDLQSLSGVAPALDGEPALSDDLHEEPPLERYQVADEALPGLAAAIKSRAAAEQLANAQRLALVPSLGASLVERATDVEGPGGRNTAWQAVIGLTWSFDLTTVAAIRAQEAAADGARAREERTRRAVHDAIHAAWRTVGTSIARSRSARVEAEVSARAAELARTRYEAGEATQLDLVQAQRDALSAEAARIRADADLVNARAQLRLAAGQSLVGNDSNQSSSKGAER